MSNIQYTVFWTPYCSCLLNYSLGGNFLSKCDITPQKIRKMDLRIIGQINWNTNKCFFPISREVHNTAQNIYWLLSKMCTVFDSTNAIPCHTSNWNNTKVQVMLYGLTRNVCSITGVCSFLEKWNKTEQEGYVEPR